MIDRDNKIPNCPNPDCVYQKVRDELNRTTRSTVLLARDEEEIDHILHHYQGTSITLPTRHPIQIVIPYGQVHINSYTAPTPVLTPTTDSSDQQQGVGEQVRVPTQQSGRGGQLGGLGCGRLYGLSIIDTNAGFVNAAQRPQEPQDQHRQQPASVSRTNGFGTSSPVAPDQAQSRVPNCPYVPGIDPRYFQPVRFSGPSYPNPVPPQHSWDLPRGVTLGLHPRPRTNYAAYFDELGASYSPGTSDRFGHAILQNSRGVFLKPIPSSATLASICDNIRGGALERVDFHDFQGRTCVGVYFISAEEAMKYIKFCREQGGVYWPESGTVSNVEAIPRTKGGHEPIKIKVARGIREGATRCLRVRNLPNNVDVELLKSQVRSQSKNVVAEVESLHLIPETTLPTPTFTMFLRMATIGTALGAKLRLQNLKYYAECSFEFLPDPTEGSLEDLGYKWTCERYWDRVTAGQQWRDLTLDR